MIQRKPLCAIALLVLLAGLAYPLVSIYGIYPAFRHRLVADIEEEATRTARHLSGTMAGEMLGFSDEAIRSWGERNAPSAQKNFQILELRILNAEGRVVYSSDSVQVGERIDKSYFHEIVQRGHPFSHLIGSDSAIPRLKRLPADVVETYVPIMKDGIFLGAFGIYYDVSERKSAMDRIAHYGTVIPILLTCIFLGLIFTILYRLERASELQESMKEKLRQEQERYERLLDNLHSEYFVYSVKPGAGMTYVSPSVQEMLGLEVEQFMSTGYEPLLTDNPVNDEARRRMAGSLAGMTQLPYEIEIRDGEGMLRILEIHEVPVLNEHDDCVSVEGVAHDVTEQRRTGAELREQEYQLAEKHEALTILFGQVETAKKEWERTMDCLEDMIFLVNSEGIIRRCNRAVMIYTGRLYDESVGMELAAFMQREGLPPQILELSGREIFHERENRWLFVRSFPYLNPHTGAGEGFVLVLQDVSEIRKNRKALEDEAAQASLSRERIASVIGQITDLTNWASRELDAREMD